MRVNKDMIGCLLLAIVITLIIYQTHCENISSFSSSGCEYLQALPASSLREHVPNEQEEASLLAKKTKSFVEYLVELDSRKDIKFDKKYRSIDFWFNLQPTSTEPLVAPEGCGGRHLARKAVVDGTEGS